MLEHATRPSAAAGPPPTGPGGSASLGSTWLGSAVISEARTIRAVAAHFVRTALRDRAFTVTALLIPINYLFLFLLSVINGANAPVAVVIEGTPTPAAERFVAALAATDTLALHVVGPDAAASATTAGRVVATITVPAGFAAAVDAGAPARVDLAINNVNADFSDDVRRSVDLATESFTNQVAPDRVGVTAREVDDVAHPVPYVPYVLLSVVTVAIMIGGFFQGGVMVAREYEKRTILDLAMAPASRLSVVLGMVAGTFCVAGVGVLVIVAVLVGVFGIRPANWAELAAAVALLQVVFAAGGVLLGTVLRRRNGLSGLAVLLSLPMLSLSGAFFPAPWSDPVIAALARLTPTYYATALLQHAVNHIETTPTSTGVDVLVLIGMTIVTLAATSVIFARRELAR